jgi:DNA-binding SARP family transcriptional activator
MGGGTTGGVGISTIGSMRLLVDGREVPLSSRKSLAIIVYLALQSSRQESRERIASMLWSESGPEQGRAALRQTIRRLKADLGEAEDLVEADRMVLRLMRPVALDIVEAIAEAERGTAPGLFQHEKADLTRCFAELDDLDPDFSLWVAVQRERLSAQMVARLEAALTQQRPAGEQLALSEALMHVDPTHEGACRAAMEAHIALGDVAQAMRVYERLWQVLDDEFDVEPSEKTQALYVAIKQGQHGRAQVAEAPSSQQDLLAPIAILVEPPDAVTLPAEHAYFAAIFRDEMIAALARFRDWLVIDGQHDGATPPTYRAYALKISMHGQQGGILLSMMLLDRADRRCVWAERHTATLEGIARLHQTALRNLAVALNVHLSAPRLQNAREIATPMGRKYELWMQAQALMGEWRADCEVKAERILRELIETTPNFAPAMVALAQIINAQPIVYPGRHRQQARLEESLKLTSRAVNLDPLDSRTHLARSWSHAIAGAHSAALSHLDLALDLNANDPWTIISAALGFAFAGELERARELVAQASVFGMKFSRAAQGYVATARYLCGDYEGAIAAAEVAGDAIINLPAWAAASHVALGAEDRAARSMSLFMELARMDWPKGPPPSEREIIDWFMGCFPIRSEAVKAELRRRLTVAAQAREKMAAG